MYVFKRPIQKFASHFTPIQIIVVYYLVATIITFGLFNIPYFRVPNVDVSFIDLVFMAVSTISVTGLTTFPIHEVFNQHGIVLLEILFQVGGLGIMMISTFIFIVSKRKISLKQRQLIMTDMNQPRLAGIVNLIRITFAIIVLIQFIFGIGFSLYFMLRDYYPTVREDFFYGFYHAISSVTNSGFDITGDSIMKFSQDPFFIIAIMLLIFVGGIGFPVILDCYSWLQNKRKPTKIPFRFSLFSKIALLAFIILFIGGAILIWLLEKDHLFQQMNGFDQWLNASFYSMTTRNAGMQLHNLNQFQPTTLTIFSILMFIGCSPSSVGGGVRTTTIAIVGLYLYSFFKNEDNINIFGRRIDRQDIRKSVVVFTLSMVMCFFCIIFLSSTEDHSLIAIIVEVSSAFGTTGLSLGITADLSPAGKILIALLMFIGRIGMLYMISLFVPKETRDLTYEYPTEKIIIG